MKESGRLTLILSLFCATLFVGLISLMALNSKKSVLSPASQNPAVWRSHVSSELGFEFSYPSNLGDINVVFEDGESGKRFVGSSTNNALILGGITKDYSAGRSGLFTDFSGYDKQGDQLVFKSAQLYDKKYTLSGSDIIEVLNNNGVEIMIISGSDEVGQEMGGPLPGTPGQGKYGALINLPHDSYPGIVFEVSTDFGLQQFKSILSTFNFTNPTPTVNITGISEYTNSQLGLSFKYPSTMTIDEDGARISVMSGDKVILYLMSSKENDPMNLAFYDKKSAKNLVIGANTWTSYKVVGSGAMLPVKNQEDYASVNLTIRQNQYFLTIQSWESQDSAQNQILSTFKFTP